MKVNFAAIVTDLRGKPVRFEESPAERDADGNITTQPVLRDMTLADLAVRVLEDPTAASKLTLARLQSRIVAGDVVDVAEGDIELILKQAEKSNLPPSLVGRADQLLRKEVAS